VYKTTVHRFQQIAFFLFSAVLALPVMGYAQAAGTGSIEGRVTDPSGAIVSESSIDVKNTATGASRTLTSDSSGNYRADLLQPGTYEITVSKNGFGMLKRGPINVEVGTVARINLELQVAGLAEVVTVTEEAPITYPEKVGVNDSISEREIANLPINGRRWDNFVLLTPGVAGDGTFGLISSRGISGLLNNNSVDGVDNNQAFFSESRGRSRVAYTYSEAAIKEFQVGLSNFSPEFGRAAGGTVNAVTKSGSNDLHGEIFYFIRDDALQAREPTLFGNKPPGSTAPLGPALKNKDRRQQYGTSFGGPLKRDKLFYFLNFDQQLRTEQFLVRADGTYFANFLSSTSAAGCNNISGVTPAPSAAQLSQLSANCDALLQSQINESGQQPRKRRNNVAFGKMDWQVNSFNTLSGSYNWHRWNAPNTVQSTQVVTRGLTDNGTDIVKTDVMILRLTSILSTQMVNEAKFQFGRDFESQVPNSLDPRTTVQSGISFGMSEFLPRAAWPNEKRLQWTDTLSYTRGRHAYKFGGDVNYVLNKTINLFNGGGVFQYNGNTALRSLAQDCPTTARALGCVPFTLDANAMGKHWSRFDQAFDARGTNGDQSLNTTDLAFFAMDTFKWRPTVTITYGLRYELQHMPKVVPYNINGVQTLGFPDQPWSAETQSFNQDTNNFGPRVSVGWDIGGTQRNVVRVGGGIYYGRIPNALLRSHTLENGLALPSFSLVSTNAAQLAAGPVYPNILAAPASASGTRTVFFMAGDYANPFVSMADVTYERAVTRNIGISATYLFTRANHLIRGHDINLPTATSTVDFYLDADASTATINDRTLLGSFPFYAGPRLFCDTTIGPASPTCSKLGAVVRQESSLNATYHGLVIQYKQRAGYGITMDANFTLSSAKDDGQSMGAAPFASRFETFFDPNNKTAEYTRSDFDMRKRFVASFMWDPDRFFGAQSDGFHGILRGWTFSGVVTLQDGQPMNPTISGFLNGGASATGCGTTGTCATSTSTINGSGGSLRPGWLSRNYIMTTGFANTDLRLQKDVRLTESKSLRFSWEVFNVFNRQNHPNRFNFQGTGFRVLDSTTCTAITAGTCVTPGIPSDFSQPRLAVVNVDTVNYQGILNGVDGTGNLSQCQVTNCLSSASGALFGPRDMQFGVKFAF
jgi:Carboxypeptidase regulatory-like domain